MNFADRLNQEKEINQPRVNYQIREVSALVIDNDGKSLGVLDIGRAISMAKEQGLDLVEVNPAAKPVVCKFMDYGKFLYDLQKQQKDSTKAHKSELKEIRLSFKIGENDLKIKAKRAKDFLDKGDHVRISLKMRGREMMFADRANAIINNFIEMAGGQSVETPKRMGNQLIVNMTKGKEDGKSEEKQNQN